MTTPSVSRRRFLGATAGATAGVALGSTVTTAFVGPAGAAASSIAVAATVAVTRTIDNVDPSITFDPPAKWTSWSGLASPRWYRGTARSSLVKDAWFEHSNPSCTRLRWLGTKGPDRGVADVFIDGTRVAQVNTNSPTVVDSSVLFDSGPLASGAHTMRVVVVSSGWVECDAISVDEVAHSAFTVDDTDLAIVYTSMSGYTNVAGRFNATAHSTVAAGGSFSYMHQNCSRLVWKASTGTDRGLADVFVDGVAVAVVDLFSAQVVHDVSAFDSGPLSAGIHQLKVVARGAGRVGVAAASAWVEIDRLVVTGDPDARSIVDGDQTNFLRYNGTWSARSVVGAAGGSVQSTTTSGSAVDLTFDSAAVTWLGSRGPDHGYADVIIDGELRQTVDTYAATASRPVTLFSAVGLAAGRHTIRVQARGTQRAAASGAAVDIDAFIAEGASNPVTANSAAAWAEVQSIQARTKSVVAQAAWQPVPYAAVTPNGGVMLTGGPMKTCFDNNVGYLIHSFGMPNYVDAQTMWTANWPSSNEGRMLMGAGHALRWTAMLDAGSTAVLRNGLNAIVATNATRQRADGFCLPWHDADRPGASVDDDIDHYMVQTPSHERANYDRAMWTRGMVAAIAAGNVQAETVLRGMYDWFAAWYAARATPVPALVAYSLGVQGHIGSTLAYHSPVGQAGDLLVAERYYVQDWLLAQLRDREPLSFSKYPLNRSHSYLVTALEAFADHYRATGAQKYLDAVIGGWEMFRRHFMFTGGGTAITEAHEYPPQSYDLSRVNSEFDGAIFWIHFNQRLHQLFPDDERYTTEIERCIYNVGLAQQDAGNNHGIRYHAMQQLKKDPPQLISTCCEVNGTGLYSRLPEMVYSVAADGLYVNLFESSSIDFVIGAAPVTFTTATSFPDATAVSHRVMLAGGLAMKLRVRVPSWATGPMAIAVNGSTVVTANPGTYAVLDRTWSNADTISYTLPAGLRVTRYTGFTQIDGYERYAVEYGPVLMTYATTKVSDAALTLPQPGDVQVPRLPVAANALVSRLTRVAGPLQFTVDGDRQRTFTPYWKAQNNVPISCYTILDPPTA